METTASWVDHYPWGRTTPETRLKFLQDKREAINRRRWIFEQQVRDRIQGFEREGQSVDQEEALALACKNDRDIRMLRTDIYALLLSGHNLDHLLEMSMETEDQRQSIREVLSRLVSTPAKLDTEQSITLIQPDEIKSMLVREG